MNLTPLSTGPVIPDPVTHFLDLCFGFDLIANHYLVILQDLWPSEEI